MCFGGVLDGDEFSLGLVDEADRVGSVAVYNYPDSFWTKELLALAQDPSRKLPKGMFERVIDSVAGLFDRELCCTALAFQTLS